MKNLLCIAALALLCTTCRSPLAQEQVLPKLPTCADIVTSVPRPTQLLFQRADHSLWLVPLDQQLNPSLMDVCRRQLTDALRPSDDVIKWSLSPDQQWLAYVQVRGWRRTNGDHGKAWLLNLWTGEKRAILDNLWPAGYNWMAEPWDVDRAVIESEPLWSQDSTRFTLVSAHAGPSGALSLYAIYGRATVVGPGAKEHCLAPMVTG